MAASFEPAPAAGGGIDGLTAFSGGPIDVLESLVVAGWDFGVGYTLSQRSPASMAGGTCHVRTFVRLVDLSSPLADAGVGLIVFILVGLTAVVPGLATIVFDLAPKLLGRVGFFNPPAFAAVPAPPTGLIFLTPATLLTNVKDVALVNIPFFISQLKYLFSLTLPSFFPEKSSSSTPTHSPVKNSTCPA